MRAVPCLDHAGPGPAMLYLAYGSSYAWHRPCHAWPVGCAMLGPWVVPHQALMGRAEPGPQAANPQPSSIPY